jgi:lysophospholipase L1-like esterase
MPPAEAEAANEWFYIALGDSMATCCGKRDYPEYYGAFIEEDLGVEVRLLNLATSGDTSGDLLKKLGTEYYRNALGKAQVVTVVITVNDLLLCPQGDRECAEEAFAEAMATYPEILEEILALVGSENAIIRTQTYDIPYVNDWKAAGVFEQRKAMMDRWNAKIVEIATQRNIPVARVDLDFNGPDGDQDPADKGYLAADGLHPGDAGALRIAELFRELGYEPCGKPAAPAEEEQEHNYEPEAGYVPDTQTAIQIAVAVWMPIYGREQIESEKPYQANLKDGVWYVTGSLPEGPGGVAEAEIARDSGCILRISHGE